MPAIINDLKENFALISAISALAAIAVVILYYAVYLSMFDRRLFFLIEYQDIAKLGLVVIGPGAGIAIMLYEALYMATDYMRDQHSSIGAAAKNIVYFQWPYIITISIGALYTFFKKKSFSSLEYDLSAVLMSLCGILLILSTLYLFQNFSWSIGVTESLPLIAFVISLGIAVSSFAYSSALFVIIKETALVDIYVRKASGEIEELRGLKLVLLLSKYSIFFRDEAVIAVASNDVVRLNFRQKIEN